MPSYTDETGVYDTTGLNSSIIQELGDMPESEVTTFVNARIDSAEAELKDDVGVPYTIFDELHLGDGDKNIFVLGPRDDPYSDLGVFDTVENNLEKVLRAKFDGTRRLLPYPEDCELGTENNSTSWTGSNATISDESTIKVAGDYGIKAVFSSSGYIQYPDNDDTAYLDKLIKRWDDWFSWLRISDSSVTITLRLYDKDGDYESQEITLRQSGIGQYVWIDIPTMTDSITWEDTRLQYIRIYVDGACTLYVDNMCFADEWTFTAPRGYFHVSVADNISSESEPSENYPFHISYSTDPFKDSTPTKITEATEWLTGIKIIKYLRAIQQRETGFRLMSNTMAEAPSSADKAFFGMVTMFEQEYKRCLQAYGGESYGWI